MLKDKKYDIIEYIKTTGECSSKDIFNGISLPISYATLKRITGEEELSKLWQKIYKMNFLKSEDFLLEIYG